MEPLPEQTSIDDLLIRRWRAEDVPALHEAITSNIDHLRPRMPWIADEPTSIEDRRLLVDGWTAAWRDGGDVVMGIWRDDRVVGATGLHHRGWPDGPEIGFWVDGACQGQGIASRSSRALVDLVASDGRYDAVYLAHDRTNLASRRVPEKLGFDLLHEVPVTDPEKIAPADAGFSVRWRMAIDWWRAGAGVGPG
ncbi:MAG: GNAT family N-acetyltransferase [Actinobacteria bacterium]|nr:GNAT family N-acetyltransferase [Actinomycetota bacterium]